MNWPDIEAIVMVVDLRLMQIEHWKAIDVIGKVAAIKYYAFNGIAKRI